MLALTRDPTIVRRPNHVRQILIVICALIALVCGGVLLEFAGSIVSIVSRDPGVLLWIFTSGHLDALNAAGAFHGEEISGVAAMVAKLKGNLVWLGATCMALIIAVVALMFMAGHSKAHDVALRTLVGIMILSSISGIVA